MLAWLNLICGGKEHGSVLANFYNFIIEKQGDKVHCQMR